MGAGDAGSVIVDAPQITMTSGAQITSTAAGTGAGGAVNVNTPGALVLDSGAQISASATGLNSGSGGRVTVAANTLTVEGGAQIASSTAGLGKGGDVDAPSLVTSRCRIAGRRSPRNRPAPATLGRSLSPPPDC